MDTQGTLLREVVAVDTPQRSIFYIENTHCNTQANTCKLLHSDPGNQLCWVCNICIGLHCTSIDAYIRRASQGPHAAGRAVYLRVVPFLRGCTASCPIVGYVVRTAVSSADRAVPSP